MKTVLIAALATITMAGGLNAQQSSRCHAASDSSGNQMRSGAMMGMMQGGMMQGGMMQGGMMSMMPASRTVMQAMRFAPKHFQALGDSLDLTAEQVAALDQLVELSATAHRDLMATARAAAEKLTDLFDSDTVDSAAVRAAALDAFESQAAMHAQILVDAAVVRGILTAAQREKLTDTESGIESADRCGSGKPLKRGG